ncbi:hypothetical protein [Laspinema olomoucense]|uniref:hypothetical protein n=1 Tax=Laspinema olomoucense TaxID=3231600 RepID=UPI0021BA7A6E|nr:hypothetical protein [Laspinema sp. D3c]MCT7994246.1 hypothetical protein [Laspinema sp. D3c]
MQSLSTHETACCTDAPENPELGFLTGDRASRGATGPNLHLSYPQGKHRCRPHLLRTL